MSQLRFALYGAVAMVATITMFRLLSTDSMSMTPELASAVSAIAVLTPGGQQRGFAPAAVLAALRDLSFLPEVRNCVAQQAPPLSRDLTNNELLHVLTECGVTMASERLLVQQHIVVPPTEVAAPLIVAPSTVGDDRPVFAAAAVLRALQDLSFPPAVIDCASRALQPATAALTATELSHTLTVCGVSMASERALVQQHVLAPPREPQVPQSQLQAEEPSPQGAHQPPPPPPPPQQPPATQVAPPLPPQTLPPQPPPAPAPAQPQAQPTEPQPQPKPAEPEVAANVVVLPPPPSQPVPSASPGPHRYLVTGLFAGLTNQLITVMSSMIMAAEQGWTFVYPTWWHEENDQVRVPFTEFYSINVSKLLEDPVLRNLRVVEKLPQELVQACEAQWAASGWGYRQPLAATIDAVTRHGVACVTSFTSFDEWPAQFAARIGAPVLLGNPLPEDVPGNVFNISASRNTQPITQALPLLRANHSSIYTRTLYHSLYHSPSHTLWRAPGPPLLA